MGTVRRDVVDVVCRALEASGDPDRAKGQQAYMKSTMPFRGITSPHLKATLRPLLADPARWDFVDEIAGRRVGPILRAPTRAPVRRTGVAALVPECCLLYTSDAADE